MEDHPLSDKQVREKLIARGASALTDTELLSILLHGSGPGGPATELAGRLLDRFEGSLARMGRCSLAELRSAESLGIARAAVLSAALELGRRLRAEQSRSLDQVQTDRDVIEMFRPLIAELPYEEFWALYLNSSNRVLDRVRISQGGVSATVVDHRLIVKRAVEKLAHDPRAQSPLGQRTPERGGPHGDRARRASRLAVRHRAARPYHRHARPLLQFP